MRGRLASFAILPLVLACIGTGYTCDKGAVEIHLPVNVGIVKEFYHPAPVRFYGQAWGVHGKPLVFYSLTKNVLLYVFENGIRLQIAVKKFEVIEDFRERCEFWMNPSDIDARAVVERELRFLRKIGAVKLDDHQLEKILEYSRWGVAGNLWIDAEEGKPIEVLGVKSCGGGPVAIFGGGKWIPPKSSESNQNAGGIAETSSRNELSSLPIIPLVAIVAVSLLALLILRSR